MNGHDGIAHVVLAGKQGFGLDTIDQLLQSVDLVAQFVVYFFPFARKVKVCGNIIATAREFPLSRKSTFEALFLAHHGLGFLRIRPQSGVCGFFVNFG
jgi:hypothetical protein